MNPKTDRKTLQKKINNYLGDYVKTLTNSDSKKLIKSVKKASKLIAKSIVRTSDESEILNSLRAKPRTEKPAAAKRPVTVRKKVKPVAVKRPQPKRIPAKPVRKATVVPQVKKTDGIAVPPTAAASIAGSVLR
ncbi:MAG: hypothetical protein HYY40_01275 [Bacteroidetes bacterium]|nr:hypothetical protein [Bacteroidota bacterium]